MPAITDLDPRAADGSPAAGQDTGRRLSADDRDLVVRKAVRGAFALGIRQTFVHCANVLGAILLARFLSPAEFGIYAVVTFLISFLGAFGGTGLAANLIRIQTAPTEHDYHAVFTFQQLAVGLLSASLWLGSPAIAAFYHLGGLQVWVFRLAAASLIATAWMVPAQVQLERELSFEKLAAMETTQALLFNTVAVSMAWYGFGAISFGAGLFARSLAGAIMANALRPRCYGWVLDWAAIKRHLSFGFYYQGAQFLCLVKDSVTPLLVGRLFGPDGVGYISWSMMLASYPVMALMVLKRIYLPMFARLQHDRLALARCFEHVVWTTTSITAPLATSLIVFVYPITNLVFGAKWQAAIPLFYWFWIANAFVPTATPAISLLNSFGSARLPLLFAFIWMAGTWLCGWPLALSYGITGIAVANCVVQLTNFWLYRAVRRRLDVHAGTDVLAPWLIAAAAAAPLWLLQRTAPIRSAASLAAFISAHLLLYAVGSFLMYRTRIFRLIRAGMGGALSFRP